MLSECTYIHQDQESVDVDHHQNQVQQLSLGSNLMVSSEHFVPSPFSDIAGTSSVPLGVVEVEGGESSRLGMTVDVGSSSSDYQHITDCFTDCFMGMEEEVVNAWYLTPTANVNPIFRDKNVQPVDLDLMIADGAYHSEEFTTGLNSSLVLSKKEVIYRQKRFKNGWEEMKKKVTIMNNRIGTKTSVHAVFENVIHFMDMNTRVRSTTPEKDLTIGGQECQDQEKSGTEDSKSNSETSVVEDHRYAAVILTQKESSSLVRDHQYNQGYSRAGAGNSSNCQRFESFIKLRHKRELQLVKYLNSLFSKKKSLEATTGSYITLEVSYEHYIFNSSNFATAEETLSNNRKKLFRVPVVTTVDESSETFSNYNPNLPQILMRVERVPAVGGITPGVHIQYVKKNENKPNAAATILRTSTSASALQEDDTIPFSITNDASTESKCSPPFPALNLDHSYGLSPRIMRDDDVSRNALETAITSSPFIENRGYFSGPEEIVDDVDHFSEDAQREHHYKTTANVATTTEPICGLCGIFASQNSSDNTTIKTCQLPQHELMWLRCFNSFCHYMVHAKCLGFRVDSISQLALLPPYLCPEHR